MSRLDDSSYIPFDVCFLSGKLAPTSSVLNCNKVGTDSSYPFCAAISGFRFAFNTSLLLTQYRDKRPWQLGKVC